MSDMPSDEVWRVISSLPGLVASSEGRLMVVPYFAPMPNGGVRQYGGEPTFGQWDGERYIYPFNGHTYKVAKLVCEAFNGTRPLIHAVCMHKDENSRNNRPGNLEWGTQKENLNAPGFIAYCRSRTGENSPTAKHQTPARTALEIARGICTKIGNNRPGDLFAEPQPKKDDHGISP